MARKLKHNLIPLPDNRMKEKRVRLTGWERYYIMRMIERIPPHSRIEAEDKLYQKVAVDA